MTVATFTSRRLRILQVIETGGPGGAETVFANVSSGLRDRGHAVHCVVAPGSWLPEEMTRRGLPPMPFVTGGAVDTGLLRTLVDTIRAEGIDVVHAHLFEGALYAALASRIAGVPCVATLHGQVDLDREGWRNAVKRWLFSRTISALVVVSDALYRDLSPLLPAVMPRTLVIPNGVATRPLGVAPLDRTPTPPGAINCGPRLVAIGNIRGPKNYPLLLEAVSRLRRTHAGAHLDIAGEADTNGLFESLKQQVTELGLDSAVTFHGFVPDPSRLLASADVFVLSSTKEGFSLATIEAMLAGVPVVATRSGGPEEILRNGETGVLVASGDADALATALRSVVDDRTLAGRLASAAQSDAAARYSLYAMVSAYESLYRELLA